MRLCKLWLLCSTVLVLLNKDVPARLPDGPLSRRTVRGRTGRGPVRRTVRWSRRTPPDGLRSLDKDIVDVPASFVLQFLEYSHWIALITYEYCDRDFVYFNLFFLISHVSRKYFAVALNLLQF